MLRKGLQLKTTYRPESFLYVVSKVFEELVNDMTVDHLEKYGLFLISSKVLGLPDLLTVACDRIAWTFKQYRATQAVDFDISEVFDRVRHTGLFDKLKSS